MYFYIVYYRKTTDNVDVNPRECPECWWRFLVKVIKVLHLLTTHSKNGCVVPRLKIRKLHNNSQNQLSQWNYDQCGYWCTTVGCSCVLSKPQYKVCAFRCCIYRKHHESRGFDVDQLTCRAINTSDPHKHTYVRAVDSFACSQNVLCRR